MLQIAQGLDALEQQFMAESGLQSEDYLKFVAEDSGNVAADGMFSIQVKFPVIQPASRKTAAGQWQCLGHL